MEASALGFLFFPREREGDGQEEWNEGRLGPLAGGMVHQEAGAGFLFVKEKGPLWLLKGIHLVLLTWQGTVFIYSEETERTACDLPKTPVWVRGRTTPRHRVEASS